MEGGIFVPWIVKVTSFRIVITFPKPLIIFIVKDNHIGSNALTHGHRMTHRPPDNFVCLAYIPNNIVY